MERRRRGRARSGRPAAVFPCLVASRKIEVALTGGWMGRAECCTKIELSHNFVVEILPVRYVVRNCALPM